MYWCVRMCTPFVALRHVACLVAAIWLHAIRVPPSKALALANMAREERRGAPVVGEVRGERWGVGGAACMERREGAQNHKLTSPFH